MTTKATSKKPRPQTTRPQMLSPQKPKRMFANSRVAPTYAASLLSTATQNLSNMVAVIGVSGAVLLTLLAARQF